MFWRRPPRLPEQPQPGHIYWTDLRGIREFDSKRYRPTLCLGTSEPAFSPEVFDGDKDGTLVVAPFTTHRWHGVWGIDFGVISSAYPTSYVLVHRLLLLRSERLAKLMTVVSQQLVISSNLEQLEAVIAIAENLGRSPMSAARYRELLGVI